MALCDEFFQSGVSWAVTFRREVQQCQAFIIDAMAVVGEPWRLTHDEVQGMLIKPNQASLLVIDVQDKLIGAVSDPVGTLARTRWLLAATHALGVPTVFSEQYPKGLGHTVAALIEASPAAQVVEKLHFSCVAANCLPASLLAREQVVVCGMETHVCVLQTVLGLRELGKQVFVVEDACDSRTSASKAAGIARMRDAGAQIVTREMVLFEWMESSSHEQFRPISKNYIVPGDL